jgi:hypothetical protein
VKLDRTFGGIDAEIRGRATQLDAHGILPFCGRRLV